MKILVVEDHKIIASNIQKGLKNYGYIVDVAYDGVDGNDLALNGDYNLIILDLMLPGMSGTEICKNIRAQKLKTPVLMLTAKSEIEDIVTGLETGADDYLTKPFAFDELIARVKALLRRQPNLISETIESGDLILDTSNLEVKKAGKTIELTRKEFDLLNYLLSNKGRVLTKDMIISNVWPIEDDVLPNTVEVYIGYLRSKIDDPFKKSKPHITTVRGFGYKLEDYNV